MRALVLSLALVAAGLVAACGNDSGGETACSLLPREKVTAALGRASARHPDVRRSASETAGQSVCSYSAPGVNVRLTVDTAPRVRVRYFNRVTEQQLQSVHDPGAQPQAIRALGDADATGPAGAYWVPAYRQLVALSGDALFIFNFSVRGLSARASRAAAERLAGSVLPAPSSPSAEPAARGSGERPELLFVAPAGGELVRGPSVVVRGAITGTGTRVTVAGRRALLRDGVFAAIAPLRPGVNRVRVVASRGGRAFDSETISVRRGRSAAAVGESSARLHPGVVPDLLAERLDVARTILRHAGLRFRTVQLSGGRLIGSRWRICSTRPPPGARIAGRRPVVLLVDRPDLFLASGTTCASN